NRDYEHTGELASLACAQAGYTDNMVILYGDLLFRSYILRDLLDSSGDIVAVVDSAAKTPATGSPDYAKCSLPDDRTVMDREVRLLQLSKEKKGSSGRWIGMVRVRGEGLRWLNDSLTELTMRKQERRPGLPDVLNHIIAQGRPVRVLYINGHWLDVNSLDDLDRASAFTCSPARDRHDKGRGIRRGGARAGVPDLGRRALLIPAALHQLRHQRRSPALHLLRQRGRRPGHGRGRRHRRRTRRGDDAELG